MIENTELLGKLAGALAKAQAAFPPIQKTATVDVKSEKAKYSYNYAPLDAILAAVRGPLSANGLALVQLLAGDALVTMLIHESGASITSTLALPPSGSMRIQEWGSALTYRRRYAIQTMLGVAAEEDTDGPENNHRQQAVTMHPVRVVGPVVTLQDLVVKHGSEKVRAALVGQAPPADQAGVSALAERLAADSPNGNS